MEKQLFKNLEFLKEIAIIPPKPDDTYEYISEVNTVVDDYKTSKLSWWERVIKNKKVYASVGLNWKNHHPSGILNFIVEYIPVPAEDLIELKKSYLILNNIPHTKWKVKKIFAHDTDFYYSKEFWTEQEAIDYKNQLLEHPILKNKFEQQ